MMLESAKTKRALYETFIHAASYTVALFILAPFLWVLITSLLKVENLMAVPTRISLLDFNLTYYRQLFEDPLFRAALRNSLVAATFSTLLTMVVCALGGYAIGTVRMRGKSVVLFSILSVNLAPALTFLIPLFMILRRLQLVDTYTGLILVFLAFQVAIGIWILRGFFSSIPAELFDAAKIDGCSRFTTFLRVGLPLARPGIIAVGLFTFLDAWNELLIPMVVTVHRRTTLTIYASSFGGMRQLNYGGATAVAVLSAIPTVLLAVIFSRQLIVGLTAGAVKG